MIQFLQCLGVIALMVLPFAGLFALMGKLGVSAKRQPDEHVGKGNGAGIG